MRLILMLVMACALGACSIVSATQQPDEKDLALLAIGTPRDKLIAEFGPPVELMLEDDARRTEVFDFVDGYSDEVKMGRALGHGVADIGTLFFWELAGTPLEDHYDGTRMLVQVTYDSDDKVVQIAHLKSD